MVVAMNVWNICRDDLLGPLRRAGMRKFSKDIGATTIFILPVTVEMNTVLALKFSRD
jgi:hypothetical protein